MAKAKKQEVISSIESLYKKYGESMVKRGDAKNKDKSEIRKLTTPFISFHRYLGGGPVKGKIFSASGLFSTGKCLGVDTPVYMYDGSVKKVQDIKVGDQLMGPDSTHRNVLSIARGKEQMYWVRQSRGDDYRVNESHILSLVRVKPNRYSKIKNSDGKRVIDKSRLLEEGSREIVNLSVKDILSKEYSDNSFKQMYRGYKSGPLYFDNGEPLPIDPYMLGVWLGDGTSSKPEITTSDQVIVDMIHSFSETNGGHVTMQNYGGKRCPTYYIAGTKDEGNPFRESLEYLNLFNNKHIPELYLKTSYENRIELLSGLLDTDGHLDRHSYEITQKSKTLSLDIQRLAISLGFSVSVTPKVGKIKSTGFEGDYYRIYILGDTDKLKLRVPHKICKQNTRARNYYDTKISIEKDIVDDYYGFEIDGDRLFVLGDGTVTHNTSLCLQLAGANKDAKILFLDAEFEWEDYSYDWVNNYFGIEEDRIDVIQPEFIEDSAQIIYDACSVYDIIIYDGFSSIGSRFEFEASFEQSTIGQAARVNNVFFKKIKGRLAKTDTTLFITNRLYDNVGNQFEPIVEPGGKGIGFYPSQKLWLTMGSIKDKETSKVVGQKVNVRVKKDKVSGNREARFTLMYNNETGFDATEDLISNASDFGIIEKSGSWYSYNGNKIGQGSDKVKTMLSDNPELYKEIFDKCISYIDDNKEQFSNMEEKIDNDNN